MFVEKTERAAHNGGRQGEDGSSSVLYIPHKEMEEERWV